MKRPPVALAVVLNAIVRDADEWHEEPTDLRRLTQALAPDDSPDPVTAAARLGFRVAHAQAFSEGNKRTALLLARWLLDNNGIADAETILPRRDPEIAALLIAAAAGKDVEERIVRLLTSRAAR